uniref:Fe2OG dioxygenase domain-containing protein n=1 Tax=Haptolina brevifila TaxID=156173 RepID=A0A7S2IG85_9EUKA|mmetsp:Transcript_65786/g.130362  ORF Transcript_65786/g.130362 Transcript_65786/m.130362 type:complete len:204 (+) Transcript_65786:39-650(+)
MPGSGLTQSSPSTAFTILQAHVDTSHVSRIRSMASMLTFDERPDSVDGRPAHELYILRDGAVVNSADLHTLMQPSLVRLTREVNDRRAICKATLAGCKPCTSLIRRYRPGERRTHSEHIDGHAAVTAVVSLSHATDFSGGFFVSNLSSRALVPLERGDAVIHASDLFHGVDVRSGERWSWVVWCIGAGRKLESLLRCTSTLVV